MASAPTGDLAPEQVRARLSELTVIDVRTPGEYASGHLPGAHNIPLDSLDRAVDALRPVAERSDLLLVCASGNRSADARGRLAGHGIEAAHLVGGTQAWVRQGHGVGRAAGARTSWSMERQVRLAAGSLVLTGVAFSRVSRWSLLLSGGVAAGLVFSAVTDTCGMAAVLGRLPHNRPRAADLESTLAALRD
jgi:rhodanese-related sulfurtransferase